jgi:hypothetical protein
MSKWRNEMRSAVRADIKRFNVANSRAYEECSLTMACDDDGLAAYQALAAYESSVAS